MPSARACYAAACVPIPRVYTWLTQGKHCRPHTRPVVVPVGPRPPEPSQMPEEGSKEGRAYTLTGGIASPPHCLFAVLRLPVQRGITRLHVGAGVGVREGGWGTRHGPMSALMGT